MTVNQLENNARFTGFLLVRTAEARTDKNGKPYLDVTLADKTGDMNCKFWDWAASGMDVPKPGSVVKVQGLVQEYNGRKQLRIERMRAALVQDEVDMSDLIACAPEKPEDMRQEIEDTIDTFQSEDLKRLVREMLRMTGEKLAWFPAAQRLHHAERSGLLHHTTSMLNLAHHVVAAYPFLNQDLLYAGVILHDLCKTTEMQSNELGNVSDYTADGQLVGHLVRGVAWIHEAAKNVGVSGEIVLLLEHMMISHHSLPEFGSPKPPMFPEAEVLARIDDLDAKMNEMQTILDRVPEGAFSEKVWSLDRRVYHPRYSHLSMEDAPDTATDAELQ